MESKLKIIIGVFLLLFMSLTIWLFASGEKFSGTLLPELIGFSLEGLLFVGIFTYIQNQREQEKKKQLRTSLEIHTTLILEALKTGNPFHWSKHAINADRMSELKEYANNLIMGLENKTIKIEPMQIKVLLETSDEIYDTLVALLPVASNISSNHLAAWSSVVSTVRLFKKSYRDAVTKAAPDNKIEWPTQDDLSLTITEFLEAAYFISKEDVNA